MRFLVKLFRDDEAATAVEYSVMLGLILMSVIGAIGMVGNQSGGMWSNIIAKFTQAGFPGP